MSLPTETVAIPVVKGLNISTSARLVEPPYLLEALNTSFSVGSAGKRYGHVANVARNGTYPAGFTRPNLSTPQLTPYGAKILDANWLFGYGYIIDRPTDNTFLEPSPYPEAGYLFGATNRDSEILGWSGHSLYSNAPGQDIMQGKIDSAVMPTLRAYPIAKSSTDLLSQTHPDAVDNGTIRVVVWVDTNSSQTVLYSIYDSQTQAPLKVDQVITPVNVPSNVRVISLGNYIHILVLSVNATNLRLYSINDQNLSVVTERSLGEATFFDVWKVDETTAVVAKVTVAQDITTEWFAASGSAHPSISGATCNIGNNNAVDVGICVHPVTNVMGIVFISDSTSTTNPNEFVSVVCNFDGTQRDVQNTMYTLTIQERGNNNTITVAPRYLNNTRDVPEFISFATFYGGTVGLGGTGGDRLMSFIFDETGSYNDNTKFHQRVMSQGFRVGDRCFCWVGHQSTLQATWFLIDENLDPVGRLAFSLANVPVQTGALADEPRNYFIRSMNWRLHPGQNIKDVAVFHGAFSYRIRVEVTDENTGLFTEPSILWAELDFLPKLRAAQAGRCTYFAGAQVWCYDGKQIVEQGFHLCPDFTLSASTTGGPGLTLLGTYSYRVDLCHRNSQNEEVRSHSLLVQTTLSGLNNTITLIIPTCLTRRRDSYFLIFRNSMQAGSPTTTWNLINSRDPSSANFKLNDQTVHSINYVDNGTVTDANSLATELHPNNSGTSYLMPFSGPACEIIAAGRDRLWVAGGELGAGQVAPSRLFEPGEVPAFNANIYRQVDRSFESITGIGFVGDIALIFRNTQTYLLEGDGPDNNASGFWSPARLVYSDVGAVSQDSLGLISSGLCFLSLGGFRNINAGGALTNIGEPIDSEVLDFDVFGTLVVGKDHEIRFYGKDRTFVYNYEYDTWSNWSIGGFGVASSPSHRAVLVSGSNFLQETPDYYFDNVSLFEHRLRFPWLHGGNLGDFQRVRRIAGFGQADPSQPHDIRVAIYYDERDFPEEWWDWTYPDSSQNEDAWGNATWGAGIWADTSSVGLGLEDSVWRFRRRPRRQKCSVFSVSISDRGSQGPGFIMTVLGLELAKKPGLDRIPAVTGGSSVNR